jgi:hypothetical protein
MQQDNNILCQFENLISNLNTISSSSSFKLHDVESLILKSVLEMGKDLLKVFLNKVVDSFNSKDFLSHNSSFLNKGYSSTNYQSIFGIISVNRLKFYNPDGNASVFPTDKLLYLPEDKFSYLLKEWLVEAATDQDFDSSCNIINKVFGFNLKANNVHRMSVSYANSATNYYVKSEAQINTKSTDFTCVSFDGKGVPIRASEVNREVDSSAVRLGKGQKKGIKREVTVSVNYTATPRIRTAETVINSFFKSEDTTSEEILKTQPNSSSKTKHLSAQLSDQKGAIKYGLTRMKDTMIKNQNCIILIDGAKGLEKAVDEITNELGITDRIKAKVLDFVHATEYVWKVVNSLMNEKNPNRTVWVSDVCKKILLGKTEEVIADFKHIVKSKVFQDNTLSDSKITQIKKTIKYFVNHKHMMCYDEYLKAGMPISTGVVESACGYFVKQRFDCSGMRWSKKGVQNLINLRAIHLNEDWSDFTKIHIEDEQKRLYSNINIAS